MFWSEAMKLSRRTFVPLAAGTAALPLVLPLAWAESYPSRPMRIVVGYPPGIAPDVTARLVAQSLSERVGQQAIVENRLGAGSNIAADTVARAAPDGYTLLLLTVTNAINATLYKDLNFDIVRDIEPVVLTFRAPNVLVVHPSLPVKTLLELIAYAKANPGKINYPSDGPGSMPQVTCELFKAMAGVDLVHVPYRGSYLPDLLSGQMQIGFSSIVTTIPYIRAGQLRVLAVTGATRSDALPDVPTVGEFLPGYEANTWHGIGTPKNTPAQIINKLNSEINAVVADPQMKERFANLGGTAIGGSPAEFSKFMASEIEKWSTVIQAANIKVE
jgi:tripartite-type tricarboxylate transporter receptor subunit TctC